MIEIIPLNVELRDMTAGIISKKLNRIQFFGYFFYKEIEGHFITY
jgi:hypothetical protein